ncbi:binding--dependent transport system inner membrane component family protein [Paraburkholderia xenovorans LB400]|uniref:ABC sulfate ester transporter, inner membrane subunit n=1 Tax=Paraburkholderia xenovorans (strain LB400) TaxID=266265 RepID=Q13IC8_PARXL|nr:ABC transporter permease [Paraburkholderia xenovorans]ABE36161.1 ABC sulfate ester transporter, inner membrane subunit [Paraburkholderia xenovorans LB400]AIP34991.1 binding--dependent transport system inner membrane component family protein [Paraburkholderia xenovorans LB400]
MNELANVARTVSAGTGARRWTRFRRGVILPLVLGITWWAVYAFGWAHSRMFVPPAQVIRTGLAMSFDGELPGAWLASLGRDLLGLAIGSLCGFGFALFLKSARWIDAAIAPTFHAIRQVALFAWIPLLGTWFGLGEVGKVVFISLAAFFPVWLNAAQGLEAVPRHYDELADVFRFTRWQRFRRIVLPAIVPSLFNGFYLALVTSWIATLGAELLMTSGVGIGTVLNDGRENFRMDQVLLGVAVVGLTGFAFHSFAAGIDSRLARRRGAGARP